MKEQTLDGIVRLILDHPTQMYGAGFLFGLLIAFVSMFVHYETQSQTAAIVTASTSFLVLPCLAGLCWGGFAPLVTIGVMALIAAVVGIAFAVGWIRDRRWSQEQRGNQTQVAQDDLHSP